MADAGKEETQKQKHIKGFKRYKMEFKTSNKEFWGHGHALVKLISVGCLFGALHMFEKVSVNPVLILLLSMEASIFIFFIFLYTFAINKYMPFIFWPITDLFNDLSCTVFLFGGAAYALRSRRVVQIPYLIAVILMGIAGIFAFIDICLQRKYIKRKE